MVRRSFFYEKAPRENLADLQRVKPRYVAIVEKPENLNRDYVIDMHHVSREVDEDIFADFLGVSSPVMMQMGR